MRSAAASTPHDHDEPRRRVGLVLAALALTAVAAGRLGIRCPVRAVVGIDCPGCGGTRALMALARGDIRQAARENAAAVLAGTVAVGYVVAPGPVSQAADAIYEHAERHPVTRWCATHPQVVACAAAVVWCAARNLWPLGPALSLTDTRVRWLY